MAGQRPRGGRDHKGGEHNQFGERGDGQALRRPAHGWRFEAAGVVGKDHRGFRRVLPSSVWFVQPPATGINQSPPTIALAALGFALAPPKAHHHRSFLCLRQSRGIGASIPPKRWVLARPSPRQNRGTSSDCARAQVANPCRFLSRGFPGERLLTCPHPCRIFSFHRCRGSGRTVEADPWNAPT